MKLFAIRLAVLFAIVAITNAALLARAHMNLTALHDLATLQRWDKAMGFKQSYLTGFMKDHSADVAEQVTDWSKRLTKRQWWVRKDKHTETGYCKMDNKCYLNSTNHGPQFCNARRQCPKEGSYCEYYWYDKSHHSDKIRGAVCLGDHFGNYWLPPPTWRRRGGEQF